jgi:hypothetical protein
MALAGVFAGRPAEYASASSLASAADRESARSTCS